MFEPKATKKELRAFESRLNNKLEETLTRIQGVEDRIHQALKDLLSKGIQTATGGTTVSLDNILQQVVALLKPGIEKQIREAMGSLDMEGISERVNQEIDTSAIEDRLVEAIKEKVFADLDQGKLIEELAKIIADDFLDIDDLTEKISENISGRVRIELGEH